MQDMIPHHHQALEMAALAPQRTNRPELLEAARRIEASQSGEIEFMQAVAGGARPARAGSGRPCRMHAHHTMAGMATPEQMAALAAAQATEFDRLFLELMIRHHDGALKMVEKLLEQPGSAFDPVLYEFTTSITNDQSTEIERMNALLVTLSDRPARRAGGRARRCRRSDPAHDETRYAAAAARLLRPGQSGRTAAAGAHCRRCRPGR
jgi:uncharacterized protein (DUF305 family)